MLECVGIAADDVHEFYWVYLEQDVWHGLVVVAVHVVSLDASVVNVAYESKHDVVISKEATFLKGIEIIVLWI